MCNNRFLLDKKRNKFLKTRFCCAQHNSAVSEEQILNLFMLHSEAGSIQGTSVLTQSVDVVCCAMFTEVQASE